MNFALNSNKIFKNEIWAKFKKTNKKTARKFQFIKISDDFAIFACYNVVVGKIYPSLQTM